LTSDPHLYFDTVLNARMVTIVNGPTKSIRKWLRNNPHHDDFTIVDGASKELLTAAEYLEKWSSESSSEELTTPQGEEVAKVVLEALYEQQEALEKAWTHSKKYIAKKAAEKIEKIYKQP
jgi:hypothetical protein